MYHRIGKGGSKYWGRAGAGIFFTDGKKVLLLKRSEKGDNSGTWGIPGGKAEKNETVFGTATRESKEECGIVKGKRFNSFETIDGLHRWTTFLFLTEPFRCKLSDEHTDWKWIDFNELKYYNLHPKLEDQIDRYIKAVKNVSFKEMINIS